MRLVQASADGTKSSAARPRFKCTLEILDIIVSLSTRNLRIVTFPLVLTINQESDSSSQQPHTLLPEAGLNESTAPFVQRHDEIIVDVAKVLQVLKEVGAPCCVCCRLV